MTFAPSAERHTASARYALAFAAEGAAVVVLSRSPDEVHETVTAVRELGVTAVPAVADVSDETAVASVLAAAVAELGGIDVLVNNAGLQLGRWNEALTLAPGDWSRLLDVNLLGVLVCIQQCRPHLARRPGAAVLNQSSVVAGRAGFGAYGVSKLALEGLTRVLASELGDDGIRVNGIAPGVIVTPELEPTIDQGFLHDWVGGQAVPRPGRPADLVGAVLFLCSEEASYITGQVLTVDGGWAAKR